MCRTDVTHAPHCGVRKARECWRFQLRIALSSQIAHSSIKGGTAPNSTSFPGGHSTSPTLHSTGHAPLRCSHLLRSRTAPSSLRGHERPQPVEWQSLGGVSWCDVCWDLPRTKRNQRWSCAWQDHSTNTQCTSSPVSRLGSLQTADGPTQKAHHQQLWWMSCRRSGRGRIQRLWGVS